MLLINNKSLFINENDNLIYDWEYWMNNNASRLVGIRFAKKINRFVYKKIRQ